MIIHRTRMNEARATRLVEALLEKGFRVKPAVLSGSIPLAVQSADGTRRVATIRNLGKAYSCEVSADVTHAELATFARFPPNA